MKLSAAQKVSPLNQLQYMAMRSLECEESSVQCFRRANEKNEYLYMRAPHESYERWYDKLQLPVKARGHRKAGRDCQQARQNMKAPVGARCQVPLSLASVKTIIACRCHPTTASQWSCTLMSSHACSNDLSTLVCAVALTLFV